MIIAASSVTPHAESGDDVLLKELRDVGRKLATAALNRDVETILAYDRADLRASDRQALKDPTSSLYCVLFDSRCTATLPSVHEILSKMRRLDIDVQLLRASGQPLHGWVVFFALFTDLSTAVERSERPPSLVPIESGGRWSTSISAAASVHPASRVPVEGQL
jgi:hypothetical protein